MLRFYPCDENLDVHYTAVMLNKGLLQVKAPGQTGKQHFESVDAWLASLPGSPSIHAIILQTPSIQPIIRHTRPKKVKWNVPSKSTIRSIDSLPWARYVYCMIKEANPEFLKNDTIRTLYNELVSCLSSYAGHIMTRPPYFYRRYYVAGIQINEGADTVVGALPPLFIQHRNLQTGEFQHTSFVFQENMNHILSVYRPLYDQIKFDVLPYMEHCLHEKKVKERTRHCIKVLANYNSRLMKLTRKFEGQAQYFRHYINSFETELASLKEPFQSSIKW
jgi:hypothetical protein